MVKRVLQVLVAVAIMAGGVWLWRAVFPSDETQIRRVLLELANAATTKAGEGNIAKVRRVDQILGCLTPDMVVHFDPEGAQAVNLNGRDEIQGAAMAATQMGTAVKVEFIDIDVAPVPAGAQSASVLLTAKVQVAEKQDFGVQALKVELAKEPEFGWRLKRLENYDPLTKE